MRRVAIAAVIGAVLAAAGCSSGESGTPAQDASTAVATPATAQTVTGFDPCSLPAVDLASAGLNPATKQVGSAGVKFPGWDICTWLAEKPGWYTLQVYSTEEHTYDEAIHNTTLYKDPEPVTVAGHSATQLHSATAENDCTVMFDAAGGPVSFQVSAKPSADQPGDACTEAARISGALLEDVPNI